MPFLFKKKSRGNFYYYIGENKRENGKVVRAWEVYVGPISKILEMVQQHDITLKEVSISKFGSIAAAQSIIDRMQLRNLVNNIISPKKNQGVDLGRYMELMVINRLLEPKSKNKISNWYKSTFLRRHFGIPANKFSSQRFWDHMNYFSIEMIEKLEKAVVNHVIPEFDLKLDYLLFDPTNFSTYIKINEINNLAKFGVSKSKRFDLLQINLCLLVTREYGIPLLHHTYPGNINDPTEFKTILPKILDKYHTLSSFGTTDLTLIFDKGNNSPENIELVNSSQYHFVGSLRPSTQGELLFLPVNEYEDTVELDNIEKYKVHRVKKKVYKKQHTLILSYCRKSGIVAKINLKSQLKKAESELQELQGKIGLPYYRKKNTLQKKLNKIINKKQIKGLIKAELISSDQNELSMIYSRSPEKIVKKYRSFGKRILFTDRHDWTTKEILVAYRSQWRVERNFHELKSADYIRVNPMYHWTEQKIRVHLFISVLSLMVQRLLHKEISKYDDTISIDNLWDELAEVYEVGYLMSINGPSIQYKLSKMSKKQKFIIEHLKLEKYQKL